MSADAYHECFLFAHKSRHAIHLRKRTSKVHVIFVVCIPSAKSYSVIKSSPRKMEMDTIASNPCQGEMCVDIYGEISYVSHAMPPKPEYSRTKPKSKTVTYDSMVVIDSLEEIIDPKLHKQPRALREAMCGRMLNHRNKSQSMTFKFWNSGTR